MIDWNHLLITAAGVIATIATIRADIQWLKRWTREHDREDAAAFKSVDNRLDTIERKL